MRAKDLEAWTVQRQELLNESDLSKHFLEIVEFWADAADVWLHDHRASQPWAHTAIRGTFPLVEDTYGVISCHWLGQLLTILVLWWEDGDELNESLTIFESRLVEEAVGKKIEELQIQAAKSVD